MGKKPELSKKIEHFEKCNQQLSDLENAKLLLEKELDKTAKSIFDDLKGPNAEIPQPKILKIKGENYLIEFVNQMFFDFITWRKNIKVRKINNKQ